MSEQGPTVFGGRYELHRRLAKGGMAEVFLARDQLLDRPVAVKVLFAQLAVDPSFVERFRREAQSAANLSHPNIVGVYDWGREGSTYYIVMEYVQGRSLSEIIRDEGPIEPMRAASIADDVAAALGFAHKNDFVHCDMKSGNVMISPEGEVKVADFGIAKAISGGAQSKLTQAGAVMGTATYFSPEQAQGQPLDGRSDLYSLGVVLYEMLTGTAPFSGDNPVTIAYKHVQDMPEPINARRSGVPEAIQAITAKLLNKNPASRYPTAGDLQNDLRRFQAGGHTLATPAPGAPPAVPITGGPSAGHVAAAGAAGVALGAAGMAAAGPQYQTPQAPQHPADPGYPPSDVTSVSPVAAMPGGGQPPGPHDPYYGDSYDGHDDKKVWLWALAGAALLALLIALVVILANAFSDDGTSTDPGDDVVVLVRVPTLIQQDRADAIQAIRDAGLVLGQITTEVREGFPIDLVIAQAPDAGTEVKEGTFVDLTVVIGPEAVPVPDVVGLTRGEALLALARAGFENTRTEMVEDDDVELDVVVEQIPAAAIEVSLDSEIILRVSAGPGAQPVPNLRGQAEADARAILEDAGWLVEVQEVQDDDVAEGFVVGTDPTPGNDLALGEIVVLEVSTGPGVVRVPNVIGDTPDEATDTLDADGLEVVPDTCFIDDPDTQVPGTVISQIPSGGIEVEVGSAVTICIGEEPEPTPTPVATATPEPTATPVPVPTATPPPVPTEPPAPTATPGP